MVIKKPLVNLQQTWPKFIVALHVVGPSCLPFLCMEFEDGASGLAKWVLIPPIFRRKTGRCASISEGLYSMPGCWWGECLKFRSPLHPGCWRLECFLFSQIYFGVRRSLAFQSLVVSQCYGGLFLMGIGFWPLPPILFLFTLFIWRFLVYI